MILATWTWPRHWQVESVLPREILQSLSLALEPVCNNVAGFDRQLSSDWDFTAGIDWRASPLGGMLEDHFGPYLVTGPGGAVDKFPMAPWVAWTSLTQTRFETYIWAWIQKTGHASFRPVDLLGNMISCSDQINKDLDVSGWTTEKDPSSLVLYLGRPPIPYGYTRVAKPRHERCPFSGPRIQHCLCFTVWALEIPECLR